MYEADGIGIDQSSVMLRTVYEPLAFSIFANLGC